MYSEKLLKQHPQKIQLLDCGPVSTPMEEGMQLHSDMDADYIH
jgi:hypothetical protein